MKKTRLKLKRKYKTILFILAIYAGVVILALLYTYRIDQVKDKQPEAIQLIP